MSTCRLSHINALPFNGAAYYIRSKVRAMLLIVPAISGSLEPLSYISSLEWICFLLVCDVAEAGWLVKYIIASFDGCSGIIVHRTVPAFRFGD